MVDSINLTDVSYFVGSPKVTQLFRSSPDTVSATFLKDKNIARKCGEQVVKCTVLTTNQTSFFAFNEDKINLNYSISVYSD